jgi:hypothetical protein
VKRDQKLLLDTVEGILIERSEPTPEELKHLCPDASNDNPSDE